MRNRMTGEAEVMCFRSHAAMGSVTRLGSCVLHQAVKARVRERDVSETCFRVVPVPVSVRGNGW